MSVLGTHLYQCTSWCCCERLHLASVIFFFLKTKHACPFHDGWFMSSPDHTVLSVRQFLIKNRVNPAHPRYSPNLAPSDFYLFPQMKKSAQRETFHQYGRGGNKKWQKHKKASKLTSSKTVWRSGKNVSIGVLHKMESTLRASEVQTCKNKYTIFFYK